MTDLHIAFVIGSLMLATLNLALLVKFSLDIGTYLRNGHDFSTILTARHRANRGLLIGFIACLIWATASWGALSFAHLPSIFRSFIVIETFVLLSANLLIPLHFEERISFIG